MKRYIFLTLAICLGVAACASGPRSPVEFRLPDGDMEGGQAAFVALQCYNCHTVAGVELPSPGQDLVRPVALGGRVYEARTDGYLITSIVYPSHRLASGYWKAEVSIGDGQSRMPDHGNIMTVDQLVDLVAFLQSTYEVRPPPRPCFDTGGSEACPGWFILLLRRNLEPTGWHIRRSEDGYSSRTPGSSQADGEKAGTPPIGRGY